MLEKWAKEVGEGTETEADRTLNMLVMMGEEKRREDSETNPATYQGLLRLAYTCVLIGSV
jgi:hypothetical protein